MATHGKAASFLVRAQEPFNGGAPLAELRRREVTPREHFFVRNHGPVPEIDRAAFRLEVDGRVRRPLSLSADELAERFGRREVEATLQCAGHRREEMMRVAPIPHELPWGEEPVSNAVWSGVPLAEVLRAAEPSAGAAHVELVGRDETERLGERFAYGGSIPLAKALTPEVLLADRMNGEPLPAAHGAPLRALVPGYIGARSVKWLVRVTVRDEPSENYFQRRAYRLFPPQVGPETVVWERGLMLGELPVTSLICEPAPGAEVAAGPLRVAGLALAGGGRPVARVDLTADGGRSWVEADLTGAARPWAWRFWEARIELPAGEHTLASRAWDTAANTQPEDTATLWNFKGYLNNAWHRVTIAAR